MKSILVHCWLGGKPVMNLGEWFHELILGKLGYGVRYWPQDQEGDEPVLMMIGSGFHCETVAKLLKRSREVWVWGEGNGREDLRCPEQDDRIHVTAFRGLITAVGYGVTDVPLCDPGWLMPWAVPIEREPSGEVLYVPHCGERYGAGSRLHGMGATDVVDPMMPRESVLGAVQRIVNAEFVLTSTLHTMIMCMAYGTPCVLHLAPGAKINMPQKWRDVFEGVPYHAETLDRGRRWWEAVGRHYRDKQNPKALLNVFPHHLAREP